MVRRLPQRFVGILRKNTDKKTNNMDKHKFFKEASKFKSKKFNLASVPQLSDEIESYFNTVANEFDAYRDEYYNLTEQLKQKESEIENWTNTTNSKIDDFSNSKNELRSQIEALGVDPESIPAYNNIIEYISFLYGRTEDSTYYKEQWSI